MTTPFDKINRMQELNERLKELRPAHRETQDLLNNLALELRAIEAEMRVLSPTTDLWGGAGPDFRPKLLSAA